MSNVHTPAPSRNSEAAYDAAAEDELLVKYRGLTGQPDAALIELIADPPALFGDADEVTAVAAIVLERRLAGTMPRVPA